MREVSLTQSAPAVRGGWRLKAKRLAATRSLYLMVLPAVLFYLVFCYLPMYGITIAFKDMSIAKGILGSDWAGLKYFQEVFRDRNFWTPFINTIIISFYKLVFAFPFPIILALFMNEMLNRKFKRFIQTILYLPRFISWVIVAGLLINLLSVNGGVVNAALELFGIEPVNFFASKSIARGLIVVTSIWKEAGWGSIIYMAALSAINPELYEAAIVDGAGRWRQIWNVTLPSIRPMIVIMLILSIGNIMNANFEQIFVLYHPLVYDKIDIIDTFVYRMGVLKSRYSYSAAVGLFKSVVSLIMILGADRMVKKLGEDGLL
jgi:putative aldouronate transport system permease protein